MSEVILLVIALALGIPTAFCFGVAIGEERAQQRGRHL